MNSEGDKSYLNEGPAAAIEDFGKVYYGDLKDFDYSDLLKRLKRRRAIWVTSYERTPAKRDGRVMKIIFNEDILLWSIGVLQPASASDALKFISYIYPEIKPLPLVKEIEQILSRFKDRGIIARVHGKSRLYSITYAGNAKISAKLRRHRDKARLFLLRDTRRCNMSMSVEEKKKLVGDPPTSDGSSTLQDSSRPIKTAATPRSPRHSGRFYWSRISKQLNYQVGLNFSSPDIFLKYYSFPSLKAIHNISPNPAEANDLSVTDFAIAVGVSPRLITSLLHADT